MTISLKSSLPGSPEAASKGERTRSALVDAAVRAFALDGFQRTSVAGVARVVRVTPAAVYRYFPDKEALFAAAVDADAAALVDLARQVLTTTYQRVVVEGTAHPVGDGVVALIEAVVQGVDDHPLVARVLSGAEPMPPERILEVTSLARLREELTGLLRMGQDLGIVRPAVPAAQLALGIETILLTQLAHAASLRRAGEPVDPAEPRRRAVAAVIDAAIRPDAVVGVP